MKPMELHLKAKFVVDRQGKKVAVQLDMPTYRKLASLLEDLEDAAALENADRRGPKFRPYNEIRKELADKGLLK